MADFKLEFSLSDKALALLDAVRDDVPRDDFFRAALQLGIGYMIESTVHMNRDYLEHTIKGNTKDYRQGRAVLRVDGPTDTPSKSELTRRIGPVSG